MSEQLRPIRVSVNYLSSSHPRINIDLSKKTARLVTERHENITNVLIDEIKKALVFVEGDK